MTKTVAGGTTMRAFVLSLALMIAPLAAAAPPPIEDYGKLPAMDLVTLSPSGARYAFIADVDGQRRLMVAGVDNKPIFSSNVGMAKIADLLWAGDDHLIIDMTTTVAAEMEFAARKFELESAIVLDVPSQKTFTVFGDSNETRVAHTIDGIYGTAQIDGHWYGYFGGFTYEQNKGWSELKSVGNRVYFDLYKVDLDTGSFELVSKGSNSNGWLVAPTGEVVARERYDWNSGKWSIVTGSSAGVTLVSGQNPDEASIMGLGRTPADLLVSLWASDGDKIEELPIAGGAAKATYDAADFGEALTERRSGVWIGTTSHGDAKLFDANAEAKLRGAFKAFPNSIVHLKSYSADFNKMIVFTEGGDDSGTYWMVDIASGAADEIGSQYPTVTSENVGPVSWFNYKAADGLAMRGVLTLPPGRAAKNLPIVVMPHGGPEAHDELQFDYWAQAFASRGYAVFQPNFRGSDGSGAAFREAGHGQWGRKMQTDISDGVAALAAAGIVNPKRACIVGASYGGYAALAGVTLQQGLYKCAVSLAGISDLSAQYNYWLDRTGGKGDASLRKWKADLGIDSSAGASLSDLSPAHLAAHADAPILLIHGKDDTTVPTSQSDIMEKALRGAGKPVERVVLPGGDHQLTHEDVRITTISASVNFVLKYNPPDP